MTLVLDGVKKKYSHFDLDCSLRLENGMVTGLIGRNGAGKSTAFKAALGLLHPDEGKVILDGEDITKVSLQKKKEIGVVLTGAGFSTILKVKDIAEILAAEYELFDKTEFLKQCKDFGIPTDQQLKEFSTGMRAKLKILCAMAHQPKLLVLDEPTSGLDVVARNEILDMLRAYMEIEGNSILISSHISSDLEGLCDDLYLIDDGKILLHEQTDVLLDEYGVLKLTREQYETIEKEYLLCVKEEPHGVSCLTKQKQFYQENYPAVVMERGNIDDMIRLMIPDKKERGMN